jgi:hypothetical protein
MGGARALGLEREVGSLEPGKKADLFLVNLRAPWLNPVRPPQLVTNLVYNANGSDVTDVVVDGRLVVRDSRATLVDEGDALRECRRVATDVWSRARALFERAYPWNLTGLPALSVPCGFADGLPVGLQLVGRPFDEASVLRVGHAYQEATRWHERHPPDPVSPTG